MAIESADRLRVEVLASPRAVAERAADVVCDLLARKPTAVLCLATGATPTETYAELAARCRDRPALFDRFRVVKLDEWLGPAMHHPATCEVYLRRHVLDSLGVTRDRYLSFESRPVDPAAECARIKQALQNWGGIDLAILGLGANGHLGLNEPGADPKKSAHVATLAEQSRNHAMLRDAGSPVTHGLTLGLADLLAARQVLLLVLGGHKTSPLHDALTLPIAPQRPASWLRRHANAICLCDPAAWGESH